MGSLVSSVTVVGVGGSFVGVVCFGTVVSIAAIVTDCVDATCATVSEDKVSSTACDPLAQAVNNRRLTNFDSLFTMRLFHFPLSRDTTHPLRVGQ